ncbi:hypothetical protein Y045_6116 [Burkholderia pseudomallei MSHR2451]|nr:hypothetical protein Y045_6116 [Burkholderia pseudomallei MSHR2451]CRY45978.1 Uncharacterised protein [Burkholderia pseudomallei]
MCVNIWFDAYLRYKLCFINYVAHLEECFVGLVCTKSFRVRMNTGGVGQMAP